MELTSQQRRDLARLDERAILIYSPSQVSIDRYGPLASKGLIEISDVGSDTAQETILKVQITEDGRAALTAK